MAPMSLTLLLYVPYLPIIAFALSSKMDDESIYYLFSTRTPHLRNSELGMAVHPTWWLNVFPHRIIPTGPVN